MFGLPSTTEFNKKIPKQVLYENLQVSPSDKRAFVEQVKSVIWRNKIAHTTTNLAAGQSVVEIEIFEVNLKTPLKDEGLLRLLDKAIQAHIIYLLELEGKYQACVGVKELRSKDSRKSTIKTYFRTAWFALEDLPVRMKGLSVDDVYENFVRQIAGERLSLAGEDEDLHQSVDRELERQRRLKRLAALEGRLCKEKQFNRQIEINNEIKNLKEQLDHE